jgi:hypothetical protein
MIGMVHTLSGYHEPAAWLSSTSCTDRKRAQRYDGISLRVISAKHIQDMMGGILLTLDEVIHDLHGLLRDRVVRVDLPHH